MGGQCVSLVIMAKRTIKDLNLYLNKRGVTHTGANKAKLLKLAEDCEKVGLPIIKGPDQSESDRDLERRIIHVNGTSKTLPRPQTIRSWVSDMTNLPPVNSGDLVIFLLFKCGWTEQQVKEKHKTHAYQLYKEGHLHDVAFCEVHQNAAYIKGKTVRETSLGATPYTTWVLLHNNGEIFSGACECTG